MADESGEHNCYFTDINGVRLALFGWETGPDGTELWVAIQTESRIIHVPNGIKPKNKRDAVIELARHDFEPAAARLLRYLAEDGYIPDKWNRDLAHDEEAILQDLWENVPRPGD